MSELDDRFAAAAEASRTLPERPDQETMLRIYALYKQGSIGDVNGKRPGFTDLVGRAKYDAWASLKGMSTDEAKAAYADLVESLAG